MSEDTEQIGPFTIAREDQRDAATGQALEAFRLSGAGVDRIDFGQRGRGELLEEARRLVKPWAYRREGD